MRFLTLYMWILVVIIGVTFGFWVSQEDPSFNSILPALLAEVVGFFVWHIKNASSLLPQRVIYKNDNKIHKLMTDFIKRGSTICIMSNRMSWLAQADIVYEVLKEKSKKDNCKIEIFIAATEDIPHEAELHEAGVKIYRLKDVDNQRVRFTLINGDRAGAAELAIASGTVPLHEISVFNMKSGPQIIELAKNLVDKARKESHGECVG